MPLTGCGPLRFKTLVPFWSRGVEACLRNRACSFHAITMPQRHRFVFCTTVRCLERLASRPSPVRASSEPGSCAPETHGWQGRIRIQTLRNTDGALTGLQLHFHDCLSRACQPGLCDDALSALNEEAHALQVVGTTPLICKPTVIHTKTSNRSAFCKPEGKQ